MSFQNYKKDGLCLVPCESIADCYKLRLTAVGFDCGNGKKLDYLCTLGLVYASGKVSVWYPAASRPRGYGAAAKRELEHARDALLGRVQS